MLHFILLLVTFAEYEKAILAVLAILGMIVVWKTGLIQQITGGQKQLIDLRSAELAQAKEKNAALELKIQELEAYNKLLILNARTNMEVSRELAEKESAKAKKHG